MSTYALYGEIIFPSNNGRQAFKVRRFSELSIESSWRSLTDTAEIILPRKVKDFDRMKVSEWFREGDPVEIWLGYDGNLALEFSGYIKTVPAGIPLTVSCEDEMYKLKRNTVSVSIKDCTLTELLKAIAPGYTVVCEDTKLGNVRYSKVSPSQILEDLQKQNIYTWFEGKELHSFGRSKRDESVNVQLELTAGESLKQKPVEATLVIMSLIRKKGKKLRVEVGDVPAGKRLTKEISGIEISEAELKREAEKLYNEAKQPGLDGDVTLFGIPRVQHGTKVNLTSELYPEKNGVYYIDAVTKQFSQSGYRQVCKLGNKVA